MNRSIASLLLSAALLAGTSTSFAQENSKQLYLLSNGSEKWMNENELMDFLKVRHENGRCGGAMDITEFRHHLEPYRPAQLAIETLAPQFPDRVTPLLGELSMTNMEATVAHLASYPNRFLRSNEGVMSSGWIADQFRNLANGRTDIRVSTVTHDFAQPSVIAEIAGQGEHANEIVVIGAHQDSITLFDRIAPGADDDASGVATLLEVFRVLSQSGFQPSRTIQFMAYAGEELGLLGSADIARDYRANQRNVVGALQFDMTMYPGPEGEITLISDHVNAQLTQFVAELIDTYVQVAWNREDCGYACSDHASWDRAGYPSAFPFEAVMDDMNHNIHTARDLPGILSPEHGLKFAKLGLAFAVEMGLVSQ